MSEQYEHFIPKLGANDYLLACGEVYATFMNDQTDENEKFEEFMKNKSSISTNRAIAASYNCWRSWGIASSRRML